MRPFLFLAALALPAATVPTPTAELGLPEPPQQKKPWTPPKTTVSDAFVTAAAKLFGYGFADPRGCEYRAVTLAAVDRQSSDAGPLRTHAWLIPAGPGSRRHAVCWDGLIYPVAEIGPFADVVADVRAAIKRHDEANGEDNEESGIRENALRRQQDLSPRHGDWLADSAVALLLRLGEGELAADLRAASQPTVEPKDAEDPFVTLAPAWAEKMFDRGLTAHAEGDDRTARSCLRPLLAAGPAIDTEALRRGWKPRRDRGIQPTDFLDQLQMLLADQNRRAASRPRDPIVCIGPGRHPDQARRIAALIDRLEDVAAMQSGYWGNGWGGDPVIEALVREGDAAIEPLLNCLESDTRLTRTVRYYQQGVTVRIILGVRDAAEAVLGRSDFYPTGGVSEGPDEQAAGIRARLARPEAKLPLAERWYRRLGDDAAGPDEWCRAAAALVDRQPESVRTTGWTSHYGHYWAGARPTLVGEPLRNRAGPSLAELLKRRIERIENPTVAAGLVQNLLVWDKAAAKPLLRPLTAKCRTAGHMESALRLMECRANAGDAAALDEYAEWVAGLRDKEENEAGDAVSLMAAHPEHPAVARVAEKLFGDRNSPLRPAIVPTEANPLARSQVGGLASGLMRIPAFRSAVLEMLKEKAPIGTVQVGEQSIMIQTGNRGEGRTLAAPDAPALYEGTIRGCDYVAFRLADAVAAAPRFELYWPEAKRDTVLAAVVTFVESYGHRIDSNTAVGSLTFPLRDRPATRSEAERHDAIFSLEGDGPTRVVKLPRQPIAANWLTLREVPTEINRFRDEKYVREKGFLQDGFVWQAEEVQINGAWRRYYGFAGARRIARVPADEIEFPAADTDRPWLRYAGKFETRLAPPTGTIDPEQPGPPRLIVGGAVPVSLAARNAGGLPSEVPSLTAHVRLRVWYSPEAIAPQGMLVPAAKTDAGWQELTINPRSAFPAVGGLSLDAAVEATLGDVNLATWFDLGRPGFYRVRLVATAADDGGEPIVFSLGSPPRR